MHIYLIRHAEISGDPHQHYQPPVNRCLSERGLCQAEALGKALSGVDFSAVYASPLGRAIQTAQALAQPRGLEISVRPWLVEWMPATITDGIDEAEYERLARQAGQIRPERAWKTAAGEGTLEMAHRIIPGFLQLLEDHGVHAGHGGYLCDNPEDHQCLALVAHGGSLGLLASFMLGVPLRPYGAVGFAHTGVAIFSFIRRVDVWYPVLQVIPPYPELGD